MEIKTTRKELLSWCLFDFANSSYTTVIVTVAFSVYFTNVVAGDTAVWGEGGGARLWGWGYSASMLVIAAVAPILGAVADAGAWKKRFLLGFTILCVSATASLFFVQRGDVVTGLLLFALSNIGFNGGMQFYNSFLIDLSTRENIGRISGYGWAVGYVGGLLSLIIVYPLIKGGFAEANLFNYRLSFPLTAAFFMLASIPTFLFLKERPTITTAARAGPLPTGPLSKGRGLSAVREGFTRLSSTFRELRGFRELLKYFFCYLLYTDAINTVIVFSAIFATAVLGFTPSELIVYFIITQISAALGALVFGPITDRIGARASISLTLIVWTGISIAAYLVQTKTGFYLIGLTAGAVLGANQSASRALLGLFTPHGKSAEFFGFFSLVGKFAAIIGPVLYGEITAATGSQRLAVLSLGAFFVAGLMLLRTVDVERGRLAATEYEGIVENENHLQ